eukprot:gene30642-35658_t
MEMVSLASTLAGEEKDNAVTRFFKRTIQGKSGWESEDTNDLFEELQINEDLRRLYFGDKESRTNSAFRFLFKILRAGGAAGGSVLRAVIVPLRAVVSPHKSVRLPLKAVSSPVVAACLCAFCPNVAKAMGFAAVISKTTRRPSTASGLSSSQETSSRTSKAGSAMASIAILHFNFVKGPMVRRMKREGASEADMDIVWKEQHKRGADELYEMLRDIKGFYMKLGQIIASKTDMLPAVYTASLRRLCDQLPPTPFSQVKELIERELKGSLAECFTSVDPVPLASATIAQVHRAVSLDGVELALKVQHPGAVNMMKADLVNMKFGCDLMELLHINIGFDLPSVVQEYYIQFPPIVPPSSSVHFSPPFDFFFAFGFPVLPVLLLSLGIYPFFACALLRLSAFGSPSS